MLYHNALHNDMAGAARWERARPLRPHRRGDLGVLRGARRDAAGGRGGPLPLRPRGALHGPGIAVRAQLLV